MRKCEARVDFTLKHEYFLLLAYFNLKPRVTVPIFLVLCLMQAKLDYENQLVKE